MNEQPSTIDLNTQHYSSATLGSMLNTTTDSSRFSSSQPMNNSTQGSSRPVAMPKNVAPFLTKVYNMVDDLNSNEFIQWSTDGTSFYVVRHDDFARSVLPRFFKHSNLSSFVRQLNMYGFHKVPHLQNGVLHSDIDSEQWEFSNPHFQRNQPDLLLRATRKKGRETDDKETPTATISTHSDLQHILNEIQVIKQHQLGISSQLKTIQSGNTTMWQEKASSRERNQRHQDTIDKTLRFLSSVFSSDKSAAISRKRPCLIEASDIDNHSQNNRNHQRNGDGSVIDSPYSYSTDRGNGSPAKVRKLDKLPEFKLEDYMPGLQGFTGIPTPTTTSTRASPTSTPNSSNAASELDDAIALNDKSKQISPMPSLRLPVPLPHELTRVLDIQQLQGLQTLIGIAQSNPAILTQLTEVFSAYQHQGATTANNSTPSTSPIPAYSQSDNAFRPTSPGARADNSSINNSNTMMAVLSSLSALSSPLPILHRQSNATTHIPEIEPKEQVIQTIGNGLHATQPAVTNTGISTSMDTYANLSNANSSLSRASTSIQTLPRSHDINKNDVGSLGSNIEALIQHIGLSPAKLHQDTLGYVDIDPYLQHHDPRNDK